MGAASGYFFVPLVDVAIVSFERDVDGKGSDKKIKFDTSIISKYLF